MALWSHVLVIGVEDPPPLPGWNPPGPDHTTQARLPHPGQPPEPMVGGIPHGGRGEPARCLRCVSVHLFEDRLLFGQKKTKQQRVLQ